MKEKDLNSYDLSYLLVFVVVCLDQFTKFLIVKFIPEGAVGMKVIPNFFSIVHVRNSGAAWGIGSDFPLALTILSSFLLILIFLFRKNLIEDNFVFSLAVSLIIAGTIGNLIDRITRHEVVDFLCFYYKRFQWPSFNLADSVICIGVFLYIIYSFLDNQTKGSQ